MGIESSGHSRGNPRIYELIEHTPDSSDGSDGKSPTLKAWPQFVEFTKVAGQPVRGPWPPHQEPRPDPDRPGATDGPVAIPDPQGGE
ncbi:hypothetical protein [Gordonia sp. (in: high G+C Gram-positive bacteria)]|uniref:hypothetical protein n=1 Tax=Gordonia sp. (in: high G+C Gram-positive bacteria) TaxID=84139 RepID=UPI0016BABFB9|nr:hypothetical protein [Gordonia sp. (in: high G+C Gram-positive bacteria)]NLG47805.1 hypothetical protein [Gordonia sp. (in: high G+C Gram-positive bacteria)]